MDRMDRVNALDLNYDRIFYNEVDSISEIDLLSIVNNWQSNLTGHSYFLLQKFMQ